MIIKNRFIKQFNLYVHGNGAWGSFFLFLSLFFASSIRAETVILKSGKQIEGKVIEETGDYIRVDSGGRALYFERKYIKSINDIPNVVQAKPPTEEEKELSVIEVSPYLKRGLEYASQARFVEAEAELNKGLEVNRSDYNIRGTLAILADVKAGKVNQDYAVYLFKGSRYLLDGEYKPAIFNLEKALQLKPGDLDIFYNLGVAYYYTKEYQKAIECFQKNLEVHPDDAEAYWFIGNVYYSAGHFIQAKDNLVKSKELFTALGDTQSVNEIVKMLDELNSASGLSKQP